MLIPRAGGSYVVATTSTRNTALLIASQLRRVTMLRRIAGSLNRTIIQRSLKIKADHQGLRHPE